VDYDASKQTDATPATVDLLIKSVGHPDLEVQGRVIPPPATKAVLDFGTTIGSSRFDFSVLATAKDPESGIRHVKLNMTRTVCFRAADGSISQAYFGTVVRKEATYTDPHHAPTQVSLGDTGIIDGRDLVADNLVAFTNANGNRVVGIGVSTKWDMEAENFAGGATTYSDVIYVMAGDHSCVTQP
jgi:hypothetical protein